jgi:plastocyanin
MGALKRSIRSAVLVMAAVGSFGAAAGASPQPATHHVKMEATGFSPPTLTVKAGDRVVWTNQDPFPHTATAKGVFDSRTVAPGKTWTYRATKRGEFDYLCTLHPIMKGKLIVK